MDANPQWIGDLNDDCTARWRGLLLRAEWMDDEIWWWCVYDENGEEIASSNSPDAQQCTTGEYARGAAERSARLYLGV